MNINFCIPFSDALVPHGYIKVRTIRLMGLVLSVFIKKNHLIHLKRIETQYTRLSLGGYLVNCYRTAI